MLKTLHFLKLQIVGSLLVSCHFFQPTLVLLENLRRHALFFDLDGFVELVDRSYKYSANILSTCAFLSLGALFHGLNRA